MRRRLPALTALVVAVSPACSGRTDPAGGDASSSQGDGGSRPADAALGADATGSDPDAAIPPVRVCAAGGDFTAIQTAIDAASAGATVEICAGSYVENLVVDRPVRLLGLEGAAVTIIDGGGNGRVVRVQGVDSPGVTIEGLTLRNGQSEGDGGALRCAGSVLAVQDSILADSEADSGGGLSAEGCQLAVDDTTITGHTASASGGGLQLTASTGHVRTSTVSLGRAERGGGIYQHGGAVEISGTVVTGNAALGEGGGIYHDSDAPLLGNQVTDNQAGGRGGGITVDQHAPLVRGNTVSGNRSGDDGGGAYLYISRAAVTGNLFEGNVAGDDAGGLRVLGSQITLRGNTLRDNRAANDGGGIKISHAESVIEDNLFSGNIAGNYGGGFELDDDHSTIRRAVIRRNRAAVGGGLHVNEVGSPIRVEATLITGNLATERGGGIGFSGVAGAVFSFVTVADNSAPFVGGADFAEAEVDVDDSIFANNGGIQVRFASGGGVGVWTYSDLTPVALVGMADPTGADGNLSVAPGFVAPAADDYHLASSSPCRNAGDPALQDPDGTRADMGAHGGPVSQ